jgi:purine nucleosidase
MTLPAARKIIIDTDPGQDDAAAIMLALASPELEVLAITAVAGNVPLALTERNARILCELAGRPNMPVYSGADRPLERALVTAEHVHGKTGLDGPDLAEPTMPLAEGHAVDFIVETVMAHEEKTVTLCALGPLTNLALALRKEPAIAGRLREIVFMGGGFFEGGNITPAAEFNVYVDPHAADSVVLASGVPIVMMPLDVTHKLLTTRKRIVSPASRPLGTARGHGPWSRCSPIFERFDIEAKYGSATARPLHDPTGDRLSPASPSSFKGRDCNVESRDHGSDLTDRHDRRRLVARHRPQAQRLKVMRDVDADGFFALLTERLAAYS